MGPAGPGVAPLLPPDTTDPISNDVTISNRRSGSSARSIFPTDNTDNIAFTPSAAGSPRGPFLAPGPLLTEHDKFGVVNNQTGDDGNVHR